MPRYQVYGLSLDADVELPELADAAGCHVDVRVRWDGDFAASKTSTRAVPRASKTSTRAVPRASKTSTRAVPRASKMSSAAPSEPANWVERRSEHETVSMFDQIGRFTVCGGTDILVEAAPDADLALVRHLLLGPVLAQLLWQRGLFALHASVLQVRGTQLAFVGASGEGKSTMAAALHAAGHTLVCDDVAALDWQARPVQVRPGFPRMRMHGDALMQLGESPHTLPRVHRQLDKRLLHARRFAPGPLPLHRVYVLTTGDHLRCDLLPLREAMLEFLRHTYYAEQFAALYGHLHHLQRAAQLAEKVPVYLLSRPRDLTRLADLVCFVEEQLTI